MIEFSRKIFTRYSVVKIIIQWQIRIPCHQWSEHLSKLNVFVNFNSDTFCLGNSLCRSHILDVHAISQNVPDLMITRTSWFHNVSLISRLQARITSRFLNDLLIFLRICYINPLGNHIFRIWLDWEGVVSQLGQNSISRSAGRRETLPHINSSFLVSHKFIWNRARGADL